MIVYTIKHRRRDNLFLGRRNQTVEYRSLPLIFAEPQHAKTFLEEYAEYGLIPEDWMVCEVELKIGAEK